MLEEEKVFPILNKFDRIWMSDPKKTFCQLYVEITGGFEVDDKTFSKLLTDYIEKNNIK